MLKFLCKGSLLVAALGGAAAVQAFSLAGPFETWQVGNIGYQPDGPAFNWSEDGDVVAPKNISGEFRINQPIVTFGFDSTFLDYFGPSGVAAAEAAIKVWNDLPPVSDFSADLSEFPLATARVNYSAQRLLLFDVKSVTMSLLAEQLGLAAPERYVWTLRQNNPDANGDPNFLTIKRNFDPISQLYSPFVNNTLYTYFNVPFIVNGAVVYYDAQEISLDAAEPNVSLASYVGHQIFTIDGRVHRSVDRFAFGIFYTGLTRDDAGGLRYIYHPDNQNYETLATGTTLRTTQQVTVVGTAGGSTAGGGGGFPGLIPAVGFAVANPNTNATPQTAIANGVRAGVNKINFIRVDTDPLLNRFRRPLVLRYSDTVMTNGVTRQQVVERSLNRPDILFVAADIGALGPPALPLPWVYRRQAAFSAVKPGNAGTAELNAGPGISDLGVGGREFIFNTIGPGLLNDLIDNTEELGTGTFVWGSFDGTTNAPVVYPVGQVSLRQIEAAVRGGN